MESGALTLSFRILTILVENLSSVASPYLEQYKMPVAQLTQDKVSWERVPQLRKYLPKVQV